MFHCPRCDSPGKTRVEGKNWCETCVATYEQGAEAQRIRIASWLRVYFDNQYKNNMKAALLIEQGELHKLGDL